MSPKVGSFLARQPVLVCIIFTLQAPVAYSARALRPCPTSDGDFDV